jgi:hypothetical protein
VQACAGVTASEVGTVHRPGVSSCSEPVTVQVPQAFYAHACLETLHNLKLMIEEKFSNTYVIRAEFGTRGLVLLKTSRIK